MTTFGFVVLNYVNHAETLACVESIRALPGSNYRIVVVDNDSPNESFEVLRERLRGDDRIRVLQSSRNGGYSYGNNVGIRALAEAGIEDVIIATSDTRVESPNLLAVCEAAKAEGVAVLGPYVRGPDDEPQNPMLWKLSPRYVAAIHFGGLSAALKRFMGTVRLARRLRIGQPDSLRAPTPSQPAPVYMVHGCFLYLSAHYLRRFPLLDEDLFMYGEEDLIAFNCLREGLPMRYDPNAKVHHRDAQSTVVQPGGFRESAVEASMKKLKSKMPLGTLLHGYVAAHRR